MRNEYESLTPTVEAIYNSTADQESLTNLHKDLLNVNKTLWNIEDHIRDCERDKNFGQDFIERFLEASPDNHCFFSNAKAPEKYLFNLPGYGLFRLRKAGIKAADWMRYCTYSDPKRFFSYRRATHQKQADYGRLISTIRLS